jgi:ubiquinone/menaquinone biosynthesis C-methylase UbiE
MSEHEIRTRKIYEAQHRLISADNDATSRIVGQYDHTSFSVAPEWFKGKVALDAGCGNIGGMIQKLHHLGISKTIGMDLGADWIELLKSNLERAGISKVSYELLPGSVLDIPFPDNHFDFVSINGVLIHLETMEDVAKAFEQGARKTRPGGYYFTSYGPCGGIVQGVIMPALRLHYRRDTAFRQMIDNLNPDTIHAAIEKIAIDAKTYAGQDLDAEFLKGLFGWDYCVFLQNYIQAPTWWSNECTPAYVEDLYREHGFNNITRLHSYNKRTDIRKFFAPLHYDRDYPLSKILYGEGYVQYIGQKI